MTSLADLRRHVERRHVDRPGHVEHRRVGLQAFDFRLVRIDRDDGVALIRDTRATARLPNFRRLFDAPITATTLGVCI